MSLPQTSPAHGLVVNVDPGIVLAFGLRGGRVTALERASVDGCELIAPGGGRLPYLQTRDGWQATGYRLLGTRRTADGVEVSCAVLGRRGPLGARLDVFEFPYLQVPRLAEEEIGRIDWWFAVEELTLAGPWRSTRLRGFRYGYRVELQRRFHCLLDAGTWELGGDPLGVSLLSQHMNPPGGGWCETVDERTTYTTAECFRKGSSNAGTAYPDVATDPALGFIIPIQAQLRGAGGSLVDAAWRDDAFFCTFFADPAHVRTLVERRPGEPGIGYLDQHWFPLGERHATAAKSVLVARVPGLTRAGAMDRWADVFDHVSDRWRAAVGSAWREPDPAFGIDQCGGAGVDNGSGADPDTFPRWEARFAELRALGFREFFLGGLGRHRGRVAPMEGNMCQPWDYSIVPELGGPERFAQFCERAHAHGLRVRVWIGFQLSDWAPARREHPEWRIDFDSGLPWDGGYRTIVALSLRRGFGDWLFGQLAALKRLGLDGVFIDSYHNLGMQCIDWGAPDLAPQSGDVLAFQARLEAIGLETTIESVGPVGLTSCGLWKEYVDEPEMAYRTALRASIDPGSDAFSDGLLTPAKYFRLLANKSVIGFGVRDLAGQPFHGAFALPAEVAAWQRLHGEIAAAMVSRRIADDGSIAWSDGGDGGVLFAVGDRVTVPAGYRATALHGAAGDLAAGSHASAPLAVWRLTRV